jgi:hypothetical protein
MNNPATPPIGRERRRKDPINRLRRFLYGMLLLAAAPVAAADQLAGYGKFRNLAAPPTPERAELATLEGLLVLRAGTDGGPDITLESATARVPQQDSGAAPQFSILAQRAPGAEGAAFEMAIADLGQFRLRLRSERSAALSAWSLGGTLELARGAGQGPVTEVPTLRINDMYGSETRYLAFEASVKQDAAQEAQLAFHWRI